jgi:hypothetical protein
MHVRWVMEIGFSVSTCCLACGECNMGKYISVHCTTTIHDTLLLLECLVVSGAQELIVARTGKTCA